MNVIHIMIFSETTGAICEESLRYLKNMVKNAKALAMHGGAIGSAFSHFQRTVASIMARSRARHVSFFQVHANRQPIHRRDGFVVDLPNFDNDEDVEVDEDLWGPILPNDPLAI